MLGRGKYIRRNSLFTLTALALKFKVECKVSNNDPAHVAISSCRVITQTKHDNLRFPCSRTDLIAAMKDSKVKIELKPNAFEGSSTLYIGHDLPVRFVMDFPRKHEQFNRWQDFINVLEGNCKSLVTFESLKNRQIRDDERSEAFRSFLATQ
jgi:hypothetical protein